MVLASPPRPKAGLFELYAESLDYVARNGCFTCPNTTNLISLGVVIEGDPIDSGILCLCTDCVVPLATLASFDPLTDTHQEIVRLRGKIAQLSKHIVDVESVNIELATHIERSGNKRFSRTKAIAEHNVQTYGNAVTRFRLHHGRGWKTDPRE
jgi:hypothetical protein